MEIPYSINYPEPTGPPQLTTFYSFKGGVGRTQSLYNVGVRLAALRRKVLMVDVDLEAPGLSIGAPLDEEKKRSKDGFAEIAADLLYELKIALKETPSFFAELVEDYQRRLDKALHIIEVPMEPRHADLADRLREEMGLNLPSGSLSLLSSGRIDPDYPRKMIDVGINEAFTQELSDEQQDKLPELLDAAGLDLAGVPDNLGLVFTAVLRHLFRNATDPKTNDCFRHVLIDSRSGLADVGGLCLRGLPDTRVVLSGLNKQNLEGTRMVLDTLSREERDEDELIVVFSPVPEGEANLVEKRIDIAKNTISFQDGGGEEKISDKQIQLLHYHPRIALEETPFTESFHRRTRIFDEYETLTDDLLALTNSDARSLVSDALEKLGEDDDSEAEISTGEKEEDENRYGQLAAELIPAAFLDENHVRATVDGICTQIQRTGPYAPAATYLHKLWISLSPDEVRVLGTTANYYYEVGRQVASESGVGEAESFFQYAFNLSKRITKIRPKEKLAWYNWGVYLEKLGQLVPWEDGSDRAVSLYHEASDKYQEATKIDPNYHQAWHNWGFTLSQLAHLVQFQYNEYDHTKSLYQKAFDKYQKATDIKPDKHEAWFSWGLALVRLGRLLRSQNQLQESHQAFTDAIEKLHESLSHGGDEDSLYWLILSLAERDQKDDIETAADHLTDLLEETPGFVVEFYDEDAEAVREHPELREILDAYREQIDEDEVDEAESPEELDTPDLSE